MKEIMYYIVKLKYKDGFFSAICKRKYVFEDFLTYIANTEFGWDIFRENYAVGETYQDLLTGKLIYNADNGQEDGYDGKKRVACLTYEDEYGYGKDFVEGVEEISREKVYEMLKSLSDEQIENYRLVLNEIENDAIRAHKEQREQQKNAHKMDRDIANFVKRGR